MYQTRRVVLPNLASALALVAGVSATLASTLDIRIDPRVASGRNSYRVKPSRYSGERLRTIRARGQSQECARRRQQLAAAA